jgi:chromosome partitioning protein
MNAIDIQTWKLFETEFRPLDLKYDYVILDCPPGISPLSEIAIRASDLVVVPTIPDFISIMGLAAFHNILWRKRTIGLPFPKQLPHILVTKFEKNVRQHKDIVEWLEKTAKNKDPWIRLLTTKVEQAAALADALRKVGGTPPTFKQKYGKVTAVLNQLVQELKGVLHGN